MKDKDKKMLFGIGIVFLFLATVGFSYAYFSSTISNKDVKNQVVETGTLQLTYTDGAEINMQNIKPGTTINKTVTVKNTGTLDAEYSIVWQELVNEIINDEMLIEANCTSTSGTCESIESTPISDKNIKKGISIASGVTHTYDFTITFKDTGEAQNYNQGKKFSGVLGIAESKTSQFEKDSWETIRENIDLDYISQYKLGDTKEVDLGDLGVHEVRIVNMSTPSECSNENFSKTACGFVLEFTDIVTIYEMFLNKTVSFRWDTSDLYQYLHGDFYNALPDDLQDAISNTVVTTGYSSTDESQDITISNDRVYLLTPKEIYGDWSGTSDNGASYTRQLDYYKNLGVTTSNYSSMIKKYNGVATGWWLRSIDYESSKFNYIKSDGNYDSASMLISYGVSPVIRIGSE